MLTKKPYCVKSLLPSTPSERLRIRIKVLLVWKEIWKKNRNDWGNIVCMDYRKIVFHSITRALAVNSNFKAGWFGPIFQIRVCESLETAAI